MPLLFLVKEMLSMSKVNKIPHTRLMSWLDFNSSGTKSSIKNFLLLTFSELSKPISRRQLSELVGIEQQSLTRPLLELVLEGKLSTENRVKCKHNRLVIGYILNPKKVSNV